MPPQHHALSRRELVKLLAGSTLALPVLSAITPFASGLRSSTAMAMSRPVHTGQPWKIGLGRVDITPPEPIWLFGHVNRNRISREVIQPIFVKAMAIEGTNGQRAVIVSADISGMQRHETNAIWATIEQQVGLRPDQVAINFSHCHALPLLDGVLKPAYLALVEPYEQWEVIKRYTQQVQQSIVKAVAQACAAMQPAYLEFGTDTCDIRDDRMKDFTDEINRDRPFFDQVPVLRMTDATGALKAVVFGYPTHESGSGEQIHGGYPGYAMEAVEKKYPGVQAMFLFGTGAVTVKRQITHSTFRPEGSQESGALLGEAVLRALDKPMDAVVAGPVASAMADVTLDFARPLTLEQLEQQRLNGQIRSDFFRRRADFLAAYEETHGRPLSSYDALQQVFRLGDDLSMVFLSGEVAEGYGYRISEMEYPDQRVWVTGFNNDLYAYVPTEVILRDQPRSRVAGASQPYWGWPGHWAPGLEDRIVNTVRDLMNQVRS